MSFRFVITRAVVVGLAVGVLMGAYMVLVVEPVLGEAIELEEELAASEPAAEVDDHAHDHGSEALFSRPEQVVGGVVAAVLYSVIAAGVFGTVYAAIRHRIPGASEFRRAVWLAAVAFCTVALLPAIKYPANPPAVGDPDTVNVRTAQYLTLIAVGLVLAWLLTRASSWLRGRLSEPARVTAITAAAILAVGVVMVVLPGPDAPGSAVPADLVWRFRIRSIGSLALLWTGIGLGLGWTLDRGVARDRRGPNVDVVPSAG